MIQLILVLLLLRRSNGVKTIIWPLNRSTAQAPYPPYISDLSILFEPPVLLSPPCSSPPSCVAKCFPIFPSLLKSPCDCCPSATMLVSDTNWEPRRLAS